MTVAVIAYPLAIIKYIIGNAVTPKMNPKTATADI